MTSDASADTGAMNGSGAGPSPERVAVRIDAFLDSSFWTAALCCAAALFAVFIVADLRLKLWADELIGLYVAGSPSVDSLVAMTKGGADATPPLYALIVRALLPVAPSEALALRLPSTLGFCAMIVAVAAYARRRLPATYALVACLLAPALTIRYGTEGRSYGLVLGFAALTLLLWSLAAEGQSRRVALPLLAVCAATMTALHYYTIFLPGCLFLAGFVLMRNKGRFDWALSAALLVPAVAVVALHAPFIVATRPLMAHNWSLATPAALARLYQGLLAWPLVLGAAAMLAAAFLPAARAPASRGAPLAPVPPHELAALALIAVAPVGVVAINMATTHVFTDRYVLWSALGVALLTALGLRRYARGGAVTGVILVGVLVAGLVAREAWSARRWSILQESGPALAALSGLPEGDPIVVTDAHVFLELTRYGPAALRDRLVYPLCPDFALRDLGYDTDAINVSGLLYGKNLNAVPCDKAFEPGREAIVAVTRKGFLPWASGDPRVTIAPLPVRSEDVILLRVRSAAQESKP